MKYEVVPNSCRICLRKYKKLRSIFKPLDEGDEPPNEMLKEVTGIFVDKATDAGELPKNICKSCELSLNLAFRFRIKALKSQRIIEKFCHHQNMNDIAIEDTGDSFNKILKDEYELEAEVKEEDIILEEHFNSSNEMKMEELEMPFSDDAKMEFLEDDEDYEEYDEYEVAYSSADDEEPLSSLQQQQQQQQSEKVLKDVNIIEPDTNEIPEENKDNDFDTVQIKQPGYKERPVSLKTIEKRIKTTSIRKIERKSKCNRVDSEKCTIVDDYEIPETTVLTKFVVKKSGRPKTTDESGYICDICGNIYKKRGRMTEHRRRHDNALSFACELCDKRFSHREKLRKHMFYHSGAKPFQCSYCSRSFYYESVKKAHEAVHKGVKPYICEVCNKAFAYAHALKKHKLIHADIKLYHCEYCDKDFRLQHHMKQHEETKLHQNTVKSLETARLTALSTVVN